jgi:integrase
MTRSGSAAFKIPTEIPQAVRRPDSRRPARSARGPILVSGTWRPAARGEGEVIELEHGITVYPARSEGGRWRAVWQEDGERQQCEAASQERLVGKLEKVTERLAADASNMNSALVSAGIEGGYLTNARLAKVHWQAAGRVLPAPRVSVSGESALWIDPDEIPSDDDLARLGSALSRGRHGERDELMANTAAYSGLRWGELVALTVPQVDQRARVITVNRKVVEVAGHLYVEAPKNRNTARRSIPGGRRACTRSPDGSKHGSARRELSKRRG